jgi:hypothetical protein
LPLPPADLTAEHLWNHSDGELFWWLSHGIDAPRGGLAMPGFADSLSEDDRWALIDYMRAHNAGAAAAGGQWAHLVPAPDFSAQCRDGRKIALAGLQGDVVRIVAGDGAGAARAAETSAPDFITVELERDTHAAPAEACTTSDPRPWAAYAIVSGADPNRLAGTQFLVDGQGWLRAHWRPGDPTDWTDSKALLAEVARIRAEPIAAQPERGQRP